MMKKITLTFLFTVAWLFCFAQGLKRIDSLKHALETAKTDSARYSTLGDLTYYYAPADAKTALNYVDERLLITRRNNNHELDESATLIMKGFILLLSQK